MCKYYTKKKMYIYIYRKTNIAKEKLNANNVQCYTTDLDNNIVQYDNDWFWPNY